MASMTLRHAQRSCPGLLAASNGGVLRIACLHTSAAIAASESEDRSAPGGGQAPAREAGGDRSAAGAGQPPAPSPHPPHWLDKHFPGAREWLQNKNRMWWIKGLVEARSEQYHQLAGRQEVLRSSIEAEYQSLHDRYASRVVDDRSETHLQVACLALATYKVLMPFLRDEQEVLKIVREHMGEQTSPALSFLMRAVSFLHRDPFATLSNRLRGLQWDYGRGFASELQLGAEEAALTIAACFYHSLYEAEAAPQLTACSCCSQDQIWLKAARYKGVVAGLESSIARGDAACCFRVRRVAPGGGGSET